METALADPEQAIEQREQNLKSGVDAALPGEAQMPAPTSQSAVAAASTLPPRSTPLESMFEELGKRADHGDVDAACRLAWDLAFCQLESMIPEMQQSTIDVASGAAAGSRSETEMIALSQRIGAWAERSAAICSGLSANHMNQAAARMAQAAQLGHILSMARFARLPPFGETLNLSQADLIVFHRENALAFLERAAAAGEPTALFELYHAYSRGHIATRYGELPVKRNPVRATAAGLALRRFADAATNQGIDERIAEFATEIGADDHAMLRAQTEAFERAFAHQGPRDFASGVFGPDIGETCAGDQ
ncbi:MAG: hypothetical protein IT478_11230 [Xanthomonadales bacterium]|nr:hypothetical protein [Xanthomonadales bacterium]